MATMKNIFQLKYILGLVLIFASLAAITSCEEEESGAAPILERVSLVPKDSTTESGFRGNTYVIFGQNLASTQQVYFNGQLAPLNPVFVRNDNIIIQIASNTPYIQGLDKIRVVTTYGEANLEFKVLQKPVITEFSPAVAAPGAEVTIVGNYFDNLEKVEFVDVKTEVATEAEVVAATSDKLVVLVPAGTKVSYINVTTPSGTTRAGSTFGFNYIIYTDGLAPGWENWSWQSTIDFASTAVVKSGAVAWKQTYTGGWGGIQLHVTPTAITEYTALKISIFGGPGTEGKPLGTYINWTKEKRIVIKEGVWTSFTIPLSDLGNPANVEFLILQDIGDTGVVAPYLLYIDDIGFI
jgi:hypothetical protein